MSETPPQNSKRKRRSRLPWMQAEQDQQTEVQTKVLTPWLQADKSFREAFRKAKAGNHHNAPKAVIGQAAEHAAEQWLMVQGLVLLERNFRCRGGEIDLLMLDGNTVVVVEVRARSSNSHGHAAETVYGLKQHRVSKAAKFWWAKHGHQHYAHLRFDVLAFDGDEAPKWFKSAWQIPA